MSDVATLEQPTNQVETTEQPVAPTTAEIMSNALWNMDNSPYQNPMQEQPIEQKQGDQQPEIPKPGTDDLISVDDYFQREFGMNEADFRNKWTEYNTPKEPIQTQQEIQWANDDSKRFFDYLKEGKEDDIYNYLNQKKQLERLEKYDVADANQAAEIIRANLQFKYKDLSPSEIDRLFTRQYSMPVKPTQGLDQTDEEYGIVLQSWESQVKEKQQDMIIDAKLAKPELANFKSKIVLPDIQKPQVPQGPTQEELLAAEAGRKAYLDAINANYQNFKGYTVTAKDGEVQLPISYNITPEEQIASKELISSFNVNDFFDKRWFDEHGNTKVNQIQEDLYLLMNRDKIHQKIATEAFTQMKAQLLKNQNNINLSGVNPTLGPNPPVRQDQTQNVSKQVGDAIWAM
jgi:hypothetical protein